MSLLVWLPMTKDLSDQGLGGCTITNDGATLDNNGKLGKCYNFDGTNDRIQVSGLNNPKNITVAFWMKRNATTGTRQFLFTAWGGVSIELGAANNLFGKVSTSGGEAGGANGGTITADSGWIHVCYTFEDKVGGKMYINGVLTGSGATTSSIAWSTTSGYIGNYSNIYLNAKMNDFRIYDRALAPKEIEILSRGLVCHYPLNGGGRGGDNLLVNTSDLTKWTKESGITTTWDSEKNMYKIEDSTHTNSRWGIYQDINVEANTSYTITVTLDGTACGAGFAVYDSSTSFPPAVIGTTGRQSYTLTSGANSTKARVYLYTNCGVSNVAWFSLPKVEKSDHTTPWMPNSADAVYAAMGYNSTTEYDVSGYGNNLDSHGSITYSSDTPRYSVCPYYQNTNMYLSATSPTSTIRTISFWVKYTSAISDYRVAFGDYKSHLAFGMINSTSACVTCGGQSKDTFTITAPTANKWYHIVVKRASDSDSADVELYINGVKQTTRGTADNWNHNSDTLMIGRRATGSSVVGYMSDFRAYVTPLTEAQIKELYNTAVSVSNNGALLGYELVES